MKIYDNYKIPLLFIGHGSPMNAIEDNDFSRGWQDMAKKLLKPEAILCISAHWETIGTLVTAMDKPKTIHDFGGFPQELFDVQYNAPGSPELATRIANLTGAQLDYDWGLDHGAWSVLLPMYPNAYIPVLQLSLDKTKSPIEHYELAKKLAPLRNEGVMIIGSGDIVHNLRMFRFHEEKTHDWAERFNNKIKELIIAGKHEEIINFKMLGPDAILSIPTAEHFLPLLYVLALQQPGEEIAFFNDKVISSISMTSVIVGKK